MGGNIFNEKEIFICKLALTIYFGIKTNFAKKGYIPRHANVIADSIQIKFQDYKENALKLKRKEKLWLIKALSVCFWEETWSVETTGKPAYLERVFPDKYGAITPVDYESVIRKIQF